MKYTIIVLSMLLTACAGAGPSSVKSSDTQYIRNTQGQTQYRITDSNVYLPDGTRVARIDSSGSIFNTQGQRIARISRR